MRVSDEQAAEDAVRMSDESKHDERVGHFTPKGWAWCGDTVPRS